MDANLRRENSFALETITGQFQLDLSIRKRILLIRMPVINSIEQDITMKQAIRVLTVFLALPMVGSASGYMGDIARAWADASIVVMGRPALILGNELEAELDRGLYSMMIERAYKGAKPQNRIEFLDPFFRSTASLHILDGSRYMVFVETLDDRKENPHPKTKNLGAILTGLCVFKVTDATLPKIEAGLASVAVYETLGPRERKAFLLQHLSDTNEYTRSFIVREILIAGIKEAIPHFQQRLAQAGTENDKLYLISDLRCLGDPGVKAMLLSWLSDDSFSQKMQIIEELVRLNDTSVVPAIRSYIDAEDPLLAVSARSALLRLGDPDGKSLCLDMLQKDVSPTARHNAIYYLDSGFKGDFTDNEKARIRSLVHDKDESIARVAGFIVEKWKPMPYKPSEAKSQ
jgi:hypothetical protein